MMGFVLELEFVEIGLFGIGMFGIGMFWIGVFGMGICGVGNFGEKLKLEILVEIWKLECYLDIMVDSFEECPTRLLRGQDIFGMRGFLTTYCDKKRGAVEISYQQFVYPNPSASRGGKIATSS
jgi:hypothetical protein